MKTKGAILWLRNLGLLLGASALCSAAEELHRPIDGIRDNSFFVEEAYNQDAGVVQHIVNAIYGVDKMAGPDERTWNLVFTQEWPVFSQTHQFSYTVPYTFERGTGGSTDGINDTYLNYRWQAYFDEKTLTAFAPRFSLVLPTGNPDTGFGNDTLGYQWSLPFSTTIGDRWFLHANAGLTYLPDVGSVTSRDLLGYNLGASAIYCVNDRFNLMLEWIGNWNEFIAENQSLDREFASIISPGVRYAFNFKDDSQLVLGLALPVGLTRAAPDIGAFIYVSFEHFFVKKH